MLHDVDHVMTTMLPLKSMQRSRLCRQRVGRHGEQTARGRTPHRMAARVITATRKSCKGRDVYSRLVCTCAWCAPLVTLYFRALAAVNHCATLSMPWCGDTRPSQAWPRSQRFLQYQHACARHFYAVHSQSTQRGWQVRKVSAHAQFMTATAPSASLSQVPHCPKCSNSIYTT